MEKLMPERVKFAPMISGVFFVLLATGAVNFYGIVRADTPCIERPPQPVAERSHRIVPYDFAACHACHATATEILTWTVRRDRPNGRQCWSLVDASGRDVTAEHVRSPAAHAPASTLSAQLASLWGYLTEAFPKATPESNASQISAPNPPHRNQSKAANANKTDSSVRGDPRSSGEGHAVKRVSSIPTDLGRDPLFQEFLRWRERRNAPKTFNPPLSGQQ